jgi:hypothetical protein
MHGFQASGHRIHDASVPHTSQGDQIRRPTALGGGKERETTTLVQPPRLGAFVPGMPLGSVGLGWNAGTATWRAQALAPLLLSFWYVSSISTRPVNIRFFYQVLWQRARQRLAPPPNRVSGDSQNPCRLSARQRRRRVFAQQGEIGVERGGLLGADALGLRRTTGEGGLFHQRLRSWEITLLVHVRRPR